MITAQRRCPQGRVLVAGGIKGSYYVGSAVLYDRNWPLIPTGKKCQR